MYSTSQRWIGQTGKVEYANLRRITISRNRPTFSAKTSQKNWKKPAASDAPNELRRIMNLRHPEPTWYGASVENNTFVNAAFP